jgi:hypothetical protein
MTEAAVSFAGNLTDDPEVRSTESGIARTMFRVAVSGRNRDSEPSFFTVVVWRDQAKHAVLGAGGGLAASRTVHWRLSLGILRLQESPQATLTRF